MATTPPLRRPPPDPTGDPHDGPLRRPPPVSAGDPRDGPLRRPQQVPAGDPRDGPVRRPPPVHAVDPRDAPPVVTPEAVGSSVASPESAIKRAPDVVDNPSAVSAETARAGTYTVMKFLSLPLRKYVPSFNPFPSTGLERGFLNFYAHAPLSASFSSNEKGPSRNQTFPEWFMSKFDPDDVYLKNFVTMIFELNHLSMNELMVTSAAPSMATRLFPTLGVFLNTMKAIQKQIPQVQSSVSKVESTSAEGMNVLAEVRDATLRIESLVKDALKSVENTEKQGASREEVESVARTFIQKLKQIDDHELSLALKEVDKLSELANIPVAIKKRMEEMGVQVKILKKLLAGATGAYGLNAVKPAFEAVPVPQPVDSAKPDSGNVKPALVVPVLPFHKVGKVAADILNQNYLGEVAHRCELSCLFGKDLDSSIAVKASSAPDVCSVLRHQEIWGGSTVRGDVRLVLPFKNRLDEAGAVVPVKQTCMAKLLYLHERACLSGSVGLHKDPLVSLGAMLGGSVSCLGTTSLCGGGRLTIRSSDGSVTGLDAAVSVSNPEWWGTASVTATLLEGSRGFNVLYNQKFLPKSTIAAQLEYNQKDKKVVACAGVEHQYDRAVKLKAMVKTNSVAQALVETQEGIAGSRVCASIRVNLRELDQAPQVGFSISTNPTWG